MAQDDKPPPKLREPPPGATEPPDHVKKPQIYEIFHSPANPDSNNPTGEPIKTTRPTFKEGIDSIKSDDFFSVHKIPCAREGFMTGIGAGTVVGMGRYFVGARAPKAANWAFGAFILGSIIQWEYCQAQRRKERAAMLRVVEVMDRKQAEKAQAAEAARLKREAEKKAAVEARKSWYKFW
ncbi:hypothetical protein ONZ43_g5287 [Nemania bipapillata]|uniref:Uncharacterized protein n=1 Tax=Nemania bipapillata TaxID=110536 RepID=A0ACC2ICN4_9PEZI|nr:hypothetical protein ONZ43_g5287 [Nemania bipapillata]